MTCVDIDPKSCAKDCNAGRLHKGFKSWYNVQSNVMKGMVVNTTHSGIVLDYLAQFLVLLIAIKLGMQKQEEATYKES